jgi:copper chaperone
MWGAQVRSASSGLAAHLYKQEQMMAEITLRIDGMHCGACVRRVSHALGSEQGLTVKEVRIGAARVESDQQSAADQAVEALAKAGYKAHAESDLEKVHVGN